MINTKAIYSKFENMEVVFIMERSESRLRDISFRSLKNGCVVTVHNARARKVALLFESDENVIRYQTDVPVKYVDGCIDTKGIRPAFLDDRWRSDFLVEKTDGSKEVYEVTSKSFLERRATVEKYELSRRYWEAQNINKWSLYIVAEEETQW